MNTATAFYIRWLGTACFEIRPADGKTILIDPYLDDSVSAPFGSEAIQGCDYIFLTHGHYDHVLDVGKLVERFHPQIYCSGEVCRNLETRQNIPGELLNPVTAGDRVAGTGFEVEIVRGVHVNFLAEYRRLTGKELTSEPGEDFKATIRKALSASLGPVELPDRFETWMAQYPPGEQLNFVFDLGGGRRIYMAGSYPDPGLLEVSQNTRASLMLLQVLPGRTLQGLEEQTVRFALASGAKTVVPQHHDSLFKGGDKTDLDGIKKLLSSRQVNFREFSPGEWYRFEQE
jgi:L-ascorbate metabolism protein UlaG (beta-lactamase superfamily)